MLTQSIANSEGSSFNFTLQKMSLLFTYNIKINYNLTNFNNTNVEDVCIITENCIVMDSNAPLSPV